MFPANRVPLFLLAALLPAAARADGMTVKEATAVSGEPFGVASITFALEEEFRYQPDRVNFRLSSEDGRVLYPVYTTEDFQLATASTLGLTEIHVDFLFAGNQPFTVSLITRDGRQADVKLTPRGDTAGYEKARARWWSRYTGTARDRAAHYDYSPIVENYLTAMLARRLELTPPNFLDPWSSWGEVDDLVHLLVGAESIRASMQRDVFLDGTRRGEAANQPLPAAAAPPAVQVPAVPDDVHVEPIAEHVPAECFYVRFGDFQNFLWLRDRVEQWGGNLRDLVTVRGIDYDIGEKLQQQLALRESVLSRALGHTLISDVALIGTDPFLRAGPSVGVLFEARNNDLLRQQIERLRREAAEANPDALEQTVLIAGRKVSFLATSDNRIRSFYAVDGDYHLVTTSRTIVRRFFEAGAGQDALARLDEFRYARHLMPAESEHRAFVYFSDPFFRNIVGPAYRVEMTRRTQALAELELVYLARLAAQAEAKPSDSIAALIEGGFLPADFLKRPDGSHTVMENGAIRDSLRGSRGGFLPVADVEITGITPSEKQAYERFALAYRSEWERMDPVIIAVSQDDLENGRERVVLDVHITPYARRHYGFFAIFLAPADRERIADVPGDLVTLQGRVNDSFAADKGILYAGLHDFRIPYSIRQGHVEPDPTVPDNARWYFGTTAEIPWLSSKGLQPDKDGYIHTGTDWQEWVRIYDGFTTSARTREMLEQVTPALKREQAERPAQLRLRIGELAEAETAEFLHAAGYMQARKASAGNTRLLHALTEQLNVPPQRALGQAQALLGGQVVCPMGGEYELSDEDELPGWHSTAWDEPSLYAIERIPQDYRFPLIEWIRGLELEFTIDQSTLTTRLELELTKNAAD